MSGKFGHISSGLLNTHAQPMSGKFGHIIRTSKHACSAYVSSLDISSGPLNTHAQPMSVVWTYHQDFLTCTHVQPMSGKLGDFIRTSKHICSAYVR